MTIYGWEDKLIGIALALIGWILLRLVRTWDRTQARIETLLKGFRTLKDRYGVDLGVEDED